MLFVTENEINNDVIFLRNCPFCGGNAQPYTNFRMIGHGEGVKEFYIKCADCGVQGPRYKEPYYTLTNDIVKATVNLWNYRV